MSQMCNKCHDKTLPAFYQHPKFGLICSKCVGTEQYCDECGKYLGEMSVFRNTEVRLMNLGSLQHRLFEITLCLDCMNTHVDFKSPYLQHIKVGLK